MSVTKEKTKHMDELHFEHQLWIKELGFYKDELVVFNRRLEEVGNLYTNKDVLLKLEHYQNQFILQNEIADMLLHELNEHEHTLASTAMENSVAIDRRAFADHPKMREKMDGFVKIYRELRKEYMLFLTGVM